MVFRNLSQLGCELVEVLEKKFVHLSVLAGFGEDIWVQTLQAGFVVNLVISMM